MLPVSGADLAPVLMDLVWKLDLPFGDAVTGPQYLLGRAARQAGLSAVFNGEGGDQLFGGWTSKPMVSAQLYADLYEDDSREQIYLPRTIASMAWKTSCTRRSSMPRSGRWASGGRC